MDDIQNNTNLRNIKEQLEQRLLPAATLTMKSAPTPAMSVHRSHVPVRVLISAYMVSSLSAPVAVSADERSPLATFAQLVATDRRACIYVYVEKKRQNFRYCPRTIS